jgi:hypothetical protein
LVWVPTTTPDAEGMSDTVAPPTSRGNFPSPVGLEGSGVGIAIVSRGTGPFVAPMTRFDGPSETGMPEIVTSEPGSTVWVPTMTSETEGINDTVAPPTTNGDPVVAGEADRGTKRGIPPITREVVGTEELSAKGGSNTAVVLPCRMPKERAEVLWLTTVGVLLGIEIVVLSITIGLALWAMEILDARTTETTGAGLGVISAVDIGSRVEGLVPGAVAGGFAITWPTSFVTKEAGLEVVCFGSFKKSVTEVRRMAGRTGRETVALTVATVPLGKWVILGTMTRVD